MTMDQELYFVRKGEQEFGPWSIVQVRRFLLTVGDPNPDYPVRSAAGGPWYHASEFEELADILEPASMTIRKIRRVATSEEPG